MSFNVRLTADFQSDGALIYQDIGLDLLDDEPKINWKFFDQHKSEMTPDQIADADTVIALTPRVSGATPHRGQRL